ncbi:hypothetical protein AeRB84_011187 [Aphanomyces euteiches]|nr:hypothetical protein AeRB84_011187 [Aphanomyces euteiches]
MFTVTIQWENSSSSIPYFHQSDARAQLDAEQQTSFRFCSSAVEMKNDRALDEPVAKVSSSVVILRRLLWFCLPLGVVIGACILLSISQRPATPNYHMSYAITERHVKVQGVNLAGWLVADYLVTPSSVIYQGVPTNVSALGEFAVADWYKNSNKKAEMDTKFKSHRDTWITEDDIKAIAAAKLNTVRVPIGFWITGTNYTESITNDPTNWLPLRYSMFTAGSADYLDKLIKVWAKTHNISVLVDITAALGAQNSKPSSAPVTTGRNFDLAQNKLAYNATTDLVKFIINRYKDDDAFLGLGLLNEPERTPNPTLSQRELFAFYRSVYPWIRNLTKRAILTTQSFGDMQRKGSYSFITDNDETMMTFSIWPEAPETVVNHWQEWHKTETNVTAFMNESMFNAFKNDITGWTGNPLFIGSWNAVKNFSSSVDTATWAKKVLDVVNLAPKGWIYSNWKNDGKNTIPGWSFKDLLAQGVQLVN